MNEVSKLQVSIDVDSRQAEKRLDATTDQFKELEDIVESLTKSITEMTATFSTEIKSITGLTSKLSNSMKTAFSGSVSTKGLKAYKSSIQEIIAEYKLYNSETQNQNNNKSNSTSGLASTLAVTGMSSGVNTSVKEMADAFAKSNMSLKEMRIQYDAIKQKMMEADIEQQKAVAAYNTYEQSMASVNKSLQEIVDKLQKQYDALDQNSVEANDLAGKIEGVKEAQEAVNETSKEYLKTAGQAYLKYDDLKKKHDAILKLMDQEEDKQQNIKNNTDKTNKSLKTSNSGLSMMLKKVLSISVAIAAIRKTFQFLSDSITAASDLEEVQNVADVAFSDLSYKVEKFAATAIEDFGLSEASAKSLASTFMALANSTVGFGETSSTMSVNLAKLAADMASFYNVSTDVAQTALSAVFTGETESIKNFGIILTEANLNAYALSKGISKTVDEMTDAEKVTLRYNYVMEKSAQAQGDFARTSDSWANQVRVLKQQFTELKTVIGEGLIQALTPLLQMLNIILERLTTLVYKIRTALGFKDTIATTVKETDSLVSTTEAVAAATEEATEAAREYQATVAGFDELNLLADNSADSSTAATATTSSSVGVEPETVEAYENVDEVVQKVSEIEKLWNRIVNAIKKFWKESGLEKTFKIIKQSFEDLWDMVKDVFGNTDMSDLWDDIKGIIKDINGILQPLIQKVTDWAKNSIKGVLLSSINQIKSVIEIIRGILDVIQGTLTGDFKQIANGTIDILSGIIKFILSGLQSVVNFLWDIVSIVAQVLDYIWMGIRNTIIIPVMTYIAEVVGLFDKSAKESINNTITKLKECDSPISDLTDKWRDGINSGFDAAMDGIENVTEDIKGSINDINKQSINIQVKTQGAGLGKTAWTQYKNEFIEASRNNAISISYQGISGNRITTGYKIAAFASGGVIDAPTVGLMGEYAGARTNPEIVAPQSVLEETINASNDGLIDVWLQTTRQIISAIQQKDMNVSISDDAIAKSVVRSNKQSLQRTGYALI